MEELDVDIEVNPGHGNEKVPNNVGILVLGILSLVVFATEY